MRTALSILKSSLLSTTFLLTVCYAGFSVAGTSVAGKTTVDFVKALNDNVAEARFYYQQNWMVLRQKAQDRGYIKSWQLLETSMTDQTPYHFMLIIPIPINIYPAQWEMKSI